MNDITDEFAKEYIKSLQRDYDTCKAWAKLATSRIKELESFIEKVAALSGNFNELELYREAQQVLKGKE